ncbi:cation transporter [Clostridium sp.]|uniref:cation diffusion facilitator family transporter n=1 Tax=Clostridium sp. TaxID=1506 RepID=UPI002609ED27|nr:cation transporter [Clostridium sp.]
MITFDGVYSLISLGLALFAIGCTNFINKRDFKKYPFGKANMEPLIVIIKSIVLLIMCSFSMFSAISEIINGGNDVEVGFALAYSLISSIGCTWVYLYMIRKSKNLNSDIVKAESSQWFMDSLISVGVLIGFLISILFKYIGLAAYSKYVDPGMVILSCLIFFKVPVTSIIEGFMELINRNADDNISFDINSLVKGIEEEYNLEESVARVAKIGRELRIEIDFILSNDSRIKSVDDMDEVREIIDENTNHFELEKWMNITFTKNKKWAM